ncbi:MAG: suppressor of fused domain protein [Myxococcota bacterium]|nr:suppressor of fused domain protein [Myxococcota bacterium]
MTDPIERSTRKNADGSVAHTVSMRLGPDTQTRPVRDDVVTLLDHGLGRFGEVMHAMDPSRIMSFASGGPPVWSVGIVEVGGDTPYTLLVTYGFSHILSPEPFREGLSHEYSLAVPKGTPISPWADAFLRHQCRYVLTQRADIRVNDCVPLRGVPMTRVPFQPEHHAMMPDSTLVGIVAAADPVLPRVSTPHGDIEVRRLIGIDQAELDRVETWDVAGFVEELRCINPLLLSPITRSSAMDYPPFAEKVNARAAREGSSMDGALFDFSWRPSGGGVTIALPHGRAARRLENGIRGRVGFGRRLVAVSQHSPPIVFDPAATGTRATQRELVIGGDTTSPHVAAILTALDAGHGEVGLG